MTSPVLRPIWSPLLVLALFAAPLWSQQKAPVITVSEPGWDFGERIQGVQDKKVLIVRNEGNWPLVIKSVKKTCGCIIPTMEIREINANSQAELVLELDTTRGEGDVKKFVILETNDPAKPSVNLPMTGFIKPVWTISTRELMLGSVKNGVRASQTFQVTVIPGYDIDITEMLASTDQVKLTRKPFKHEDGSYGWDVTATLEGRVETGYFEAMLLVQTTYEPLPQRALRLQGDIVSSTRVTPTSISLPPLLPEQITRYTVAVEKTEGDGLSISEVRCDDPHVTWEIVAKTPGKAYDLVLSFAPAKGERSMRGQLTLLLEEPGAVEVTIGYHGRVLLP